ncbi:MAG: mechanosensitive ion channel family protein, partial [Candidatus Pseudothioglobus sp.]
MNDFIQNISTIQMVAVLLVLAIIAHIVLGSVLKQITKHSGTTKTQIDDYLINAISAPLKLLIWYGWLYFSLLELTSEIQSLGQIVGYISIAPIFILTWGILRLISSTESYMLKKEGNVEKDSVRLFTRLIKILFVFAIILGVAQFYGYAVSSILTLGGVGGIVVGFAAKDMLANIFGG